MMEKMYQFHMQKLAESIEAVNWKDKEVYGSFLAQTFYYVRHSTRLLAIASGRFGFNQDQMHYRFAEHISEETRHEKLALKDLEFLGFKNDRFKENAGTKAFYQCQYYQIEHIDPVCLLGYIMMLEGLAVTKGLWLHETVTKFHGPKVGAFLKVHANEDVDHIQKAFKQVEGLTSSQKEWVASNFEQSTHVYQMMLSELSHTEKFSAVA